MSRPYEPYDPYDAERTQRSDWSEGSERRNSRPQRAGGNSRPNGGQGSGQYGGYGQANPPSRGSSRSGSSYNEAPDDGYGRYGPPSRGRSSGSSGGYGDAGGSGYGDGYGDEERYGRPSSPSRSGYGRNSRPGEAYGPGGARGSDSYGRGGYAEDEYAQGAYRPGGYSGYDEYAGSDSAGYGNAGGAGGYGGGGYGQQWGPAAQTMYEGPQYDQMEPPVRKKSRRKLWITLGVVAALLLVTCAGVGFVVVQYTAPAAAAGLFCGSLKAQNYAASYALLGSTLRTHITQTQFAQANTDLDRVEGVLTNCKAATGSNAYTYSLGGSSATAVLVAQRANSGSLQGAVHLRNEGGRWKVVALDPSLLGVDLQALVSMDSYCTAMQQQSYADAYALLGQSRQKKQNAADYTRDAQWHDQIDGTINVCQVAGVGTGNDASIVNLTVGVTRGKSAMRQATVELGLEDAGWRIHTAGPETVGSDLEPAYVGARFCDDLAKGNYGDLMTLLSTAFLGGASVDVVTSVFSGTYNGIKWDSCKLDLSTYKVSSTAASFNVQVTLTDLTTGRNAIGPVPLKLVKEGRNWKIDDFKLQ